MSFFRSPKFRRVFYVLVAIFVVARVGHRLLSTYTTHPVNAKAAVHLQH